MRQRTDEVGLIVEGADAQLRLREARHAQHVEVEDAVELLAKHPLEGRCLADAAPMENFCTSRTNCRLRIRCANLRQ